MTKPYHDPRPAFKSIFLLTTKLARGMLIPMKNETRAVDGFLVERSFIIGTRNCTYTVWEPLVHYGESPWYSHSTIQFFVRLGTRALPDWIEALEAGSPARREACRKFRRIQHDLAIDLIVRAFPEAAPFVDDRHDAEVWATLPVGTP